MLALLLRSLNMAMRNHFLNFLIHFVPFIVIWRLSMAKTPHNPPLKTVKDGKTSTTSSSQRETNLVDLPIDIIINILNRLPLKSLFQFRFVCRMWRALLYTPKIVCYVNQLFDKKYTLQMKSDVSCQSDVIWKFKIPIELQSLDFMLLEPVNGILCICGPLKSHVSYVYLWNPLTNEFKALPRPIVHMGYVADNFGFGFVPNSNDYKVVRVLQHERKPDAWIEIYSLNRNSWRRIRDSCSSSEITGNESDGSLNRYVGSFSVFRDSRHFPGDGDLTVDLEKEVITEADHKKKHCKAVTWKNERNAIYLKFPEDDLVLCDNDDDDGRRYSSRFDFTGSLVSLGRDHVNLG